MSVSQGHVPNAAGPSVNRRGPGAAPPFPPCSQCGDEFWQRERRDKPRDSASPVAGFRPGGGGVFGSWVCGAAVLLVLLPLAVFGVSENELKRYGFGERVSRDAARGIQEAPASLPTRPQAARRPIPRPVLPNPGSRRAEPPRLPAPRAETRPVKLVPGIRAPRRVGRDAGVTEVDPLVARLFPGQKYSKYAGNQACLKCHEEKGRDRAHTLFGKIASDRSLSPERRGCEGCHGPGEGHPERAGTMTNPARLDSRASNRLCLSCHADERLVRWQEWHLSGHDETTVGCMDCHSVHHPRGEASLAQEPNTLCLGCHPEVRTQFMLRSRHPLKQEGLDGRSALREGKVKCLDCHRAMSARHGPGHLAAEPRDLCVTCHAETRGPFVFEHDTLSGDASNDCSACHLPHGSPHRDLLTVRGRGLCLRCHTDRVTHAPGPSCTTTACHRDIHGSNRSHLFLGRL